MLILRVNDKCSPPPPPASLATQTYLKFDRSLQASCQPPLRPSSPTTTVTRWSRPAKARLIFRNKCIHLLAPGVFCFVCGFFIESRLFNSVPSARFDGLFFLFFWGIFVGEFQPFMIQEVGLRAVVDISVILCTYISKFVCYWFVVVKKQRLETR